MTTNISIMPPPTQKTDALAIWSLILGILSYVCLGPLAAIPAIICGHIARSKIKSSAESLGGSGMALAGLILGYVGLMIFVLAIIVGIVAGTVMPSLTRARAKAQTMSCINNLKQIEIAKSMWMIEHDDQTEATPPVTELDPYIQNGFQSLQCPQDGTYTVNPCSTPPECSIPEHSLTLEDSAATPDAR